MTPPSFPTTLPPKDVSPRRYKDAPSVLHPSGYVLEWCPTHPKATHGVHFQHRIVMEEHLGRFLDKRERIHHANGVRHDNSIQNLVLVASHSDHMKQHWNGKGKNDPELIERVRIAAADIEKNVSSLGVSPSTVNLICREHNIQWVPAGQRGRARLLTDEMVREALQGRSTIEAASHLSVNVGTLYNRFGHLLSKRAKPGFLDQHKQTVLKLAYVDRIPRSEIAERYGVSAFCVTKSIQRWSRQDAKQGGSALPPLPRHRPGPRPERKGRDTE
jgi:hypothetical protein